jgi:hypothetical protein
MLTMAVPRQIGALQSIAAPSGNARQGLAAKRSRHKTMARECALFRDKSHRNARAILMHEPPLKTS